MVDNANRYRSTCSQNKILFQHEAYVASGVFARAFIPIRFQPMLTQNTTRVLVVFDSLELARFELFLHIRVPWNTLILERHGFRER